MSQRLSVIEAAYRFDKDEPDFMRGLGEAALPLFPDAEFLLTYSFGKQRQSLALGHTEIIVGDPEILQIINVLFDSHLEDQSYEFIFLYPPCLVTALHHHNNANAMRHSAELGIRDFVGIVSSNGSDSVLIVGSPYRDFRDLSVRDKVYMQPVADHLAAAWRLRLWLEDPASSEGIEAIFDTNGRELHAQGAARSKPSIEALRAAVLARERQRASHSTKKEESFWPELIKGKWTLIDRFESLDKRYIVAYRNSAKPSPVRSLSPKEMQTLALAERGASNKHIALSLEMSEAAVSRRLQGCMRKLGIESLVELSKLSSLEEGNLFSLGFGTEQLLAVGFSKENLSGLEVLSRAEREIAADILRGCSNQEIAARRKTALSTVINQIASIFTKLGVSSRRGLAVRLMPKLP